MESIQELENNQELKQQATPVGDDVSMVSTDLSTLNEAMEILEIGLLLDCTGSMSSWIRRAQ
jgi:hypothetical protein